MKQQDQIHEPKSSKFLRSRILIVREWLLRQVTRQEWIPEGDLENFVDFKFVNPIFAGAVGIHSRAF